MRVAVAVASLGALRTEGWVGRPTEHNDATCHICIIPPLLSLLVPQLGECHCSRFLAADLVPMGSTYHCMAGRWGMSFSSFFWQWVVVGG